MDKENVVNTIHQIMMNELGLTREAQREIEEEIRVAARDAVNAFVEKNIRIDLKPEKISKKGGRR